MPISDPKRRLERLRSVRDERPELCFIPDHYWRPDVDEQAVIPIESEPTEEESDARSFADISKASEKDFCFGKSSTPIYMILLMLSCICSAVFALFGRSTDSSDTNHARVYLLITTASLGALLGWRN